MIRDLVFSLLITFILLTSGCEERVVSTSSVTVNEPGMRWRGVLTEEPANAVAGDLYYNKDDETAYLWTGETWVSL